MADKFGAKVIVALLFAIAFAIIGWTAPVLYAQNAPANQFIEVHHFDAQDAPPSADYHYICFDRTVHDPSSGIVYTELFLVTNDGRRIEVGGKTANRYFQGGRRKIVTRLDIPEGLEPGTYRYALIVQLSLADGRVHRDFKYTSEPFHIGPNEPTPTKTDWHC